jgi:arsenate reductase
MKRYNILFLCTHNSARSVLGEALASTHPSKKFVGYSAGSTPGGKVNPFAAQIAKELGYPESQLRSKSWDEFSLPDAPKMDFIVTVCDNAAGEVCPFWPGNPVTAHWGFPDPSQVQGTDIEKRAAFNKVMNGLKKRIDILADMPLDKLDSMSLKNIHVQIQTAS